MNKLLRKFSIYELVLIAVMAALGIAVKPVVVPVAHLIAGPLMIPSGALAGGFYMLWLVVGFGLTGKYGTGTLISFVQALMVIFMGAAGSHGIMSLFSYTAPGIFMDLILFLIGHRVCCRPCAFIAGAAANFSGTFAVNLIFFRLPPVFLLMTMGIALLSGGMGGLLSWELLKILKKFGLAQKPDACCPDVSEHITALVGPSGCGKTTLTKILMGLLKPCGGRVMLDGEDLSQLSLAQIGRRMGYVMQNPAQQLFCTSIREEVEYGLRNLDLSREEIQERASEYLAYFHLDEYEERFPFELSGGEKQRLVLAAVLAMQPKFLILDEPTAALDVYRRSLLGRRLRKIKHGLGCGVLIVSHDMDFIKTYCDRIVKMETAEGGGICASLI